MAPDFANAAQNVAKPGRYVTVDGMRGVAAMSVVFYHLYANVERHAQGWIPGAVDTILAHGYLGVHVFFVISGFVIALSVGRRPLDGRFVGRFMIRRSIRLDPLYWASIVTALCLTYLSGLLFESLGDRGMPSTAKIVFNFLYLQNLLGYGDIVSVYWTLCLELQFYIVFVLIILFLQRLVPRGASGDAYDSAVFHCAFLAVGLVSLVDQFDVFVEGKVPGLFLPFWYEFYIGVLICWTVKRWSHPAYIIIFAAVTAGLAFATRDKNAITCLAAGLFIFLAVAGVRYIPKLSGRIFQFLGRISYSLYLFHPILGWSMVSLLEKVMGPPLGMAQVLTAFVIGVMFSIASAYIMYRVIEYPTLQWSRRLKKY